MWSHWTHQKKIIFDWKIVELPCRRSLCSIFNTCSLYVHMVWLWPRKEDIRPMHIYPSTFYLQYIKAKVWDVVLTIQHYHNLSCCHFSITTYVSFPSLKILSKSKACASFFLFFINNLIILSSLFLSGFI